MTAAELCRRAAELQAADGAEWHMAGLLLDATYGHPYDSATVSKAIMAAHLFEPLNSSPGERVLALLFAAAMLEDE